LDHRNINEKEILRFIILRRFSKVSKEFKDFSIPKADIEK
jgi:hypothetical protein